MLEIPTPYRTPLLERIQQRTEIDLSVFYCAGTDPIRHWDASTLVGAGEVLSGVTAGGASGGMNWKLNPRVWKRLSQVSPDVVAVGGYAHPTMQIAMTWAKAHRRPYVILSETHDLQPRAVWRRVVKAPVAGAAIRGAKAFLPTGTPQMDYLARRGGSRDSMFLFPNAPDLEKIASECATLEPQRQTLRRELSLTGSPTFLYLGRLVGFKGVDVLINAFRVVRSKATDASLLIAGDGPMRSELEALATGIGGVTFLGAYDPSRLSQLCVASDVFVLPSTLEPWGVVVMEAQAAGLPVIVSDRVGCSVDLVLDGETGWLFPAGDPDRLAAQMLTFISDEDSMKKLGKAGRALVGGWGYNSCVESYRRSHLAALEVDG